MVFDPLLAGYNEVLSNIILNFALENSIYRHDNWKKARAKELLEAANSEYSKFVAVYGRRRVGKTFLIRETFNYSFTFQHTGLARGKMKDQLLSFRASLQTVSGKKYNQFKNWYEAFLH